MRLIDRSAFLAGLLILALLAAACGSESSESSSAADQPTTSSAADGTADADTSESPGTTAAPATTEAPGFEGELIGVFELTAADCSAADSVSGSYFRMAQIGGTLDEGPYIPNPDSTCADLSYSPLAPGTDGGLITGTHQPAPDPAFDERGSGLADQIAQPVTFLGLAFSMATTPDAPTPTITASDGNLDGNLSAVAAYYASLIFNQGAPKPDGSTPGLTSPTPVGTIDPDTGAYVLEWASQIVGGPFDNFTGIWHLEGTFVPS